MYTTEQTQAYLHGFKTFHQRYHAYPHEVDKAAAVLCDTMKNETLPDATRITLMRGVANQAADLLHPQRAVPQVFDRFVDTLFDIATPFEKRRKQPAEPTGEAGVMALSVIALCVKDTHPARADALLARLHGPGNI